MAERIECPHVECLREFDLEMTIPDQTVWVVECRNMGCIFQRSASYGLIRDLADSILAEREKANTGQPLSCPCPWCGDYDCTKLHGGKP